MGRGEAFNANPSEGRKGYRTEDEPIDERPLLFWREFWDSDQERLVYEAAVAGNPRPWDEMPLAYVARLSGIVTNDPTRPLVRRMPRRGLSQRQWAANQWDAKRAAACNPPV